MLLELGDSPLAPVKQRTGEVPSPALSWFTVEFPLPKNCHKHQLPGLAEGSCHPSFLPGRVGMDGCMAAGTAGWGRAERSRDAALQLSHLKNLQQPLPRVRRNQCSCRADLWHIQTLQEQEGRVWAVAVPTTHTHFATIPPGLMPSRSWAHRRKQAAPFFTSTLPKSQDLHRSPGSEQSVGKRG